MASVATLGFSIISRYSGHGVTQARRDLATLRAQMATLNDDLNSHTKLLDGIPKRWQAIGAAVAAVGPSLIPLAAQAVQVAGSFTAMSAAVGVSLGAYALSVKNAIDTTNGMAKAGKALSSQQKDFLKSQDALNKSFAHFGQGFRDLTLKGVTDVFEGAARALDKLQSVAKAITPEINRVAAAFNNWTKSASFDNYIKLIGAAAPVAFRNLSDAARMFFNVIGDGFRAFLPSGVRMTQTIKDGAAALKQWSDGGGFQRFLEYVRNYGPQLNAFWDSFRAALKNVFVTLESFSSGSLDNVTDALRGIASIDPGAVKAFASSLLLMKSPLVWLVINCPPLRDMIISILSSLNAQTVYAIAAAFTAWRVSIMLVNAGLIATPVGAIITALALLGVAIVYIATKTTWFQTAWEYTWNAIKTVATTVFNFLTNGLGQLALLLLGPIGILLILANNWSTIWNGIKTAALAVWSALTTAWNAVVSGLTTAWTTVSGALTTAWNAVWTALKTAAQAVWTALTTAWTAFTSALATAWTTVSTALTTAWNTVWNGLSTAAKAVWAALQVAWSAFTTALATAWTTVSSALTSAWNTVWNALKTAAQAVWSAMQTAWNAFLQAVNTAWTTVSSALKSAWQAVWTALQTAATTVWNAMKTAWQAFLTAVQTIWTTVSTALKTAWQAVWTAIKLAADTVWNALKVAWQAFGTAINTIWTTVSNTLKAAWTAVWNAIKTAAETVWNALKTAWTAIGTAINTIWNTAGEKLKAAWSAVWNTVKETATKVWADIKSAVEKGINALLTPINFLIKGFNAIAKAVSLDISIPEIHVNFANGGMVGGVPTFAAGGTVNFAKGGGALGGFAPGRDTVPAILSRGEGVLTPEAVRGIGGGSMVNSLNRKFAGHRGAGRGAAPLPFALGGMTAWHKDNSSGWGFATGGNVDPNPSGNSSDGVVGPGGVITGGQSDTGGNDTSSPHAPGSGGLTGIDFVDKVLGFIGRAAFEAALGPALNAISANFGPVGEIFAGTAKKIGKGMIDWLVGQDEKKKEEYASMAVAGAKSVSAWADLAAKAMVMGGLDPAQLPKFLALMAAESSGNPNAINTTDINAKNGIPSQGLMQIIPPNFVKYHVAGTSNNILDPLANMAASAAYIRAVYGGSVPGSPYALGTPGATAGTHLVGENGPELLNFRGGETVTPAPATSRILSGEGQFGTGPQGIEASLRNRSFEDVSRASKQMAETVKAAWTKVVTDSTTGWQTLTPVLGQASTGYGTDMTGAIVAMDTANTSAWTNMNAQTAVQWGLMRDGTMLDANTMLAETVPASISTMQVASDDAWSNMTVNTEQSWLAMDATSFTPLQGSMTENIPMAAGTMNSEVSNQGYQMSENIQSAVASSEPPLQSLIGTMQTALTMSSSLGSSGSGVGSNGQLNPYSDQAASLLGPMNPPPPGGTAYSFAAQHPQNRTPQTDAILESMGYMLAEDGSWVGPNFNSTRAAMKGYAKGTENAAKGPALVGEKGPELLNFSGGESVLPAAKTSSVLSGMGAMAPAAAPALPDVGGMIKKAVSGGSSDEVVQMIQQIIEAAQQMSEAVKTAWTGVTSAAQQGQSTMNPVLAALIAQYGTNVPAALTTMSTANTTQWAAMNAATNAQWLAMQAGVFTPANAEMTTTVPASLAAMSAATGVHWTTMKGTVDTTWGGMRDGAFAEANDHMTVKMPTWGTEMDTGVSTAWSNMAEATSTSWSSMEQGTAEPVNWIIDNSYNNGIAAMWNAVAGVIWEDGGRELPSVAHLAKGGPVHGPGTATSDSVPARLSRGEHVWTAREVQKAGGHAAVMRMRSGVMGGKRVGAHGDGCGGYATGGVVGDLKRGNLWPSIEGGMKSAVDSTKSQLTDIFGRTSGSADVVSPADWIEQYVKKDDELNKFVGGPPWIPGVSDQHVSYDGYTVNQRTAEMLDAAKSMGASFSLYQGSFSSGVAASAGTHDGGGVVDVGPASSSNVGFLRGVGFAAWGRGPEWGSPSFASHIHAVALGDPTVSPAAADQVASFLAGGNGLADGGPDNFSGGVTAMAANYKNVDPADIKQNVVSYDQGGLLQPGYTLAHNGTGKPEPVGHNLVPKGGDGGVNFHITVNGNADPQQIVDGINSQVLPKLRQYLNKGTGSNG